MAGHSENKTSMMEIFLRYLTRTRPAVLFLHLLWIIIVCCVLSTTYIFAFHFPSLMKIYDDAHNIKAFDQNLKMSMKQDEEINKLLLHTMTENSAGRAYVFRYHNGLAAISGVPFFFQTNTHEVISPGVARVLPYNQRLPASINGPMNNYFSNNKCSMLNKLSADPNSYNYYHYQSRGSEATVRCPIFLENGDLLGFVGIDYTTATDDKVLKAAEERLKETAKSLSNIFSNTHK